MLSSVLRSERAVRVNIEIMRAFVRLRSLLSAHADLARRLDEFGVYVSDITMLGAGLLADREVIVEQARQEAEDIIARAQQTLTEHSLTLSPSRRSRPGLAGTTPR
jgi:hypothetical protein